MSLASFPATSLHPLGGAALAILHALGLVHLARVQEEGGEEGVVVNNLTLINFVLKLSGPMHERTLTTVLLVVQVLRWWWWW